MGAAFDQFQTVNDDFCLAIASMTIPCFTAYILRGCMVTKNQLKKRVRTRENLTNKTYNFITWASFDRLVSISTLLGIIFAVYIFVIEADRRSEDLEARKYDTISKSWETLVKLGVGDNGRSRALRFLLENKERLIDLDLSCETISRGFGRFKNTKEKCIGSPLFSNIAMDHFNKEKNVSLYNVYFNGVRFERLNMDRLKIYAGDFEGAIFGNAVFDTVKFDIVSFIDTKFIGFRFINSNFNNVRFNDSFLTSGKFENSNLSKVNFSDVNFYGVKFLNSNLSGANFTNVSNFTLEIVDSWAWDDEPPINLPKGLSVRLCSAKNRPEEYLFSYPPEDCFDSSTDQ